MDHCSFQEPLGRLIKGKHHLDIYDYTVKGEIIEDLSEGGHIFRKSDIFPLRPCKFMGFQTACPNNPKKILTVLYGEDLAPTTICKRGEWAKRD